MVVLSSLSVLLNEIETWRIRLVPEDTSTLTHSLDDGLQVLPEDTR